MPRTVYPRWRGEHMRTGIFIEGVHGLSPLARGTLILKGGEAVPVRFIPAGAGNTKLLSVYSPRDAVYPRWRGEHSRYKLTELPSVGLSPLARGTQRFQVLLYRFARFIPAGAGNTPSMSSSRARDSVYPRWRGEHFLSRGHHRKNFGLSPLARGTL